jgi:hypothetical protein
MPSSPRPAAAARSGAAAADLEAPLAALEQRIEALRGAIVRHDAAAIDHESAALHGALAAAIDQFSRAARRGAVPPSLRLRLSVAGARVAAQRDALARATAALDRAMDVILPAAPARVAYGVAGQAERSARGTGLTA